ncbi:hypothetical protein FHX34_103913 [Actinoplanes teichomyceticus]|uniref:Uncharacterized protein n=1 Tax=Actinoplanes teichomyceticus TaxID=1867 RepID=A0A561WC03_ACTTI|nr:hypothetical protein FHX34_103913 [Actinoplanes teichomyceticus]
MPEARTAAGWRPVEGSSTVSPAQSTYLDWITAEPAPELVRRRCGCARSSSRATASAAAAQALARRRPLSPPRPATGRPLLTSRPVVRAGQDSDVDQARTRGWGLARVLRRSAHPPCRPSSPVRVTSSAGTAVQARGSPCRPLYRPGAAHQGQQADRVVHRVLADRVIGVDPGTAPRPGPARSWRALLRVDDEAPRHRRMEPRIGLAASLLPGEDERDERGGAPALRQLGTAVASRPIRSPRRRSSARTPNAWCRGLRRRA